MKNNTPIQGMILAVAALLIIGVSCNKPYSVSDAILPLETYKFYLYDSVEGTTSTTRYTINRLLEFKYDPNVDKCYMPNKTQGVDTFDRHHFWKRGYINRTDFLHRIIFKGDTITIHHNVYNQIGESGFRYTHGVRL